MRFLFRLIEEFVLWPLEMSLWIAISKRSEAVSNYATRYLIRLKDRVETRTNDIMNGH